MLCILPARHISKIISSDQTAATAAFEGLAALHADMHAFTFGFRNYSACTQWSALRGRCGHMKRSALRYYDQV